MSKNTGRGQTLFLVKHATRKQCQRFQASGYAFAPTQSVIEGLARYSQMDVAELRPHFDSMAKYSPSFQALEHGVHLACFIIKPSVHQNFDVLVDKRSDNLLPAIQLRSVRRLERWQQDILNEYTNWKAKDLITILPTRVLDSSRSVQHRKFLSEIVVAIGYLSNRIGSDLFAETVFTSTAFEGPCVTRLDTEGNMTKADVFAFRLVADLHTRQPSTAADEYIPFRLFASQQRCYSNSPDHATFASLVHQEFASVEGRRSEGSISERRSSVASQKFGKSFRDHFGIGLRKLSSNHSSPARKASTGSEPRCDNVSEKALVRHPAPNPFGGILVSNQVSVSVSERVSVDPAGGADGANIRAANAVEVAASSKEKDTFADELLVLALKDHVLHQRSQHRSMALSS